MENSNYLPECFFCYKCLWTLFTSIYFTSYVNTLLSTALHASFHQTLAFALWFSAIVENYQVKVLLSEDNQNPFLKKSQQKTILYVVWCGLGRFNLIPRDKLSYRFFWHNAFWRRTKLISSFFKKKSAEKLFCYFYLIKLIYFLSNKISLLIGNLSSYLLKFQFADFELFARYTDFWLLLG